MTDIMKDVKKEIKSQYSKLFKAKNWKPFKTTADYYFELASKLKEKDIDIKKEDNKLWIRNERKRLYLGIATELLIKAAYLKKGYNINKPKKGNDIDALKLITTLDETGLNEGDTYTLGNIIDNFHKIEQGITAKIKRGLIICEVFRNKEGHISVPKHDYVPQNYRDIEFSIIEIYKICFGEELTFHISMEDDEKADFSIKAKNRA